MMMIGDAMTPFDFCCPFSEAMRAGFMNNRIRFWEVATGFNLLLPYFQRQFFFRRFSSS